MDTTEDITRTLRHNFFGKRTTVGRLWEATANYAYDQSWVSAPAACGDAYRHTVSYDVGDYHFVYRHIAADGGLSSAKFTMAC